MFKSIKPFVVAGTAILVVSAPCGAFAADAADGGGSASRPVRGAVIGPVSRAGASQPRFQWGDAGVVAASTVVLLRVGVGAAGALRHRGVRRSVAG